MTGRTRNENQRRNEIWNSFEAIINECEERKIDLLLIAGDLFHRQPLLRELKELDAMFCKLSNTEVVFCAGNHDYLTKKSFYRTFEWPTHVHMIQNTSLEGIAFPKLQTEVYGFSYDSKEREDKPYLEQPVNLSKNVIDGDLSRILLLHGGDNKHVPFSKEEVDNLGYDYVALGHIHKPQELIPNRMAFAGALEPIDKNDVGKHGYIYGEIDGHDCRIQFIPFARREYVHLSIPVKKHMTGYDVKSFIREQIEKIGTENIYKIVLEGFRNSEILLDTEDFDVYGNVIEFIDHTKLSYDIEKLKRQNADNILGCFIGSFEGYKEDTVEYKAMLKGVQALMETRRG